jgi:hypothetical protein
MANDETTLDRVIRENGGVPPAGRGIRGCRCPLCGVKDGLNVRVSDGAVCCSDCGDELTAEELEAAARSYLRLAAWAKSVPAFTFGEEEEARP